MSTDGRTNPNSLVPEPVEAKVILPSPEELGRSSTTRGGEPIVWTDDRRPNWRPEVINGGGDDHYVRTREGEKFQRLDGSADEMDRMRARHDNRMEYWRFFTAAGVSLLVFVGCVFGGALHIPQEAQSFLYAAAGTAGSWVYRTSKPSLPSQRSGLRQQK
ncbi:hypothetical protein GCM10017776_25130 [Streptomyces griseoluteus]|nr:hypothetical protein GCM10017776_25130 [Streptomyces griseoluteus]